MPIFVHNIYQQPGIEMAKKVDVAAILREKAPKLANKVPGLVIN